MDESVEFEPVDWITAGAIGEPGRRVFYIQARHGDRAVALLAEKGQVAALAELAQELLARVGVGVVPDDLQASAQALIDPLPPLWRAGTMSLGMDADGTRFILEVEQAQAEDSDEPPAAARFWMSREQLVALAAYAAFAVEAGARQTCRLCGRPIDPDGHVCPSSNGHGRLSS